MPKPPKIRQFLLQLKSQLAKLSFRTGLWVLAGCAVSYLLAFVPLLFPLSLTTKGVLWFIFFGLAKTLQYTALLILGKEGAHRIRDWWRERKRKSNFPE
jgi:HAD hydrolase, family IA, variant 3